MPRPGSHAAPSGVSLARVGPGERIGRYEVVRHLATGGMSEVYLARSTGIEGFEKLVVVKRILPEFASEQSYIEMFLDEARLAATLHHQNIAQIFDIGEDRGQYFFAQEYVRGHDLHEIMQRVTRSDGDISYGIAVSIVSAAAAGLHYAHDKRDAEGHPLHIVHCDVSPSNVLVSYEGGVKLIDFGIARATANKGQDRRGTIKGKASYLSPEQAEGEGIDRRADVFGLGILLYETTTKSRLFVGDHWAAVLEQVRECAIPPPSSRRAGFPRALEAILRRALARDPDQRYQTAQDLALDLDRFLTEARMTTSSIQLATWLRETFGDPEPTNLNLKASSAEMLRPRTELEGSGEMNARPPFLPPSYPVRPSYAPPTHGMSAMMSDDIPTPVRKPPKKAWWARKWTMGAAMATSAVVGGTLTFGALGDAPPRRPKRDVSAPVDKAVDKSVDSAVERIEAPVVPSQVVEEPAREVTPPRELEPAKPPESKAVVDASSKVPPEPQPVLVFEPEPAPGAAARKGEPERQKPRVEPDKVKKPKKAPVAERPAPAPKPEPVERDEWSKDSPFLPE